MSRAIESEKTFTQARLLAQQNGMDLSNPSDGCYQLRCQRLDWIVNMYPRRSGFNPRMYWDPHHRGPFLKLPSEWTLLDAVQAAVDAAKEFTAA